MFKSFLCCSAKQTAIKNESHNAIKNWQPVKLDYKFSICRSSHFDRIELAFDFTSLYIFSFICHSTRFTFMNGDRMRLVIVMGIRTPFFWFAHRIWVFPEQIPPLKIRSQNLSRAKRKYDILFILFCDSFICFHSFRCYLIIKILFEIGHCFGFLNKIRMIMYPSHREIGVNV